MIWDGQVGCFAGWIDIPFGRTWHQGNVGHRYNTHPPPRKPYQLTDKLTTTIHRILTTAKTEVAFSRPPSSSLQSIPGIVSWWVLKEWMDGWMDFNNREQCIIIIIHSFKMSLHQLIFLFVSLRISSAACLDCAKVRHGTASFETFEFVLTMRHIHFKSVQTMRKSFFYYQLFIL